MKTLLTRFVLDHNKKFITCYFNNKQTLHLEYLDMQIINSIIDKHYGYCAFVNEDHYDMYLELVPFTVINKPVYL